MSYGQTALQRRAREYLEGRSLPVEALELAREVLGLTGGPPEAARHLMETLLGGCPGFVREGPSAWRYAGPRKTEASPPLPSRWLVLEGAHWTDPAGRRHLAELAGLACPPEGGAFGSPRLFVIRPEASPAPGSPWSLPEPDGEETARPLAAHLGEILPWLEGAIVISYRPEETITPLAQALAAEYGLALEVEVLSLRRLARRVRAGEGQRGLEELAAALGLAHRQSSRAGDRAALAAEVFQVLHDRARAAGLAEARDLLDLQVAPEEEIDFRRFAFDRDWLAALPERPGIYRMSDREGALLYVGKARDLRARLGSYFRGAAAREEREARILERLYRIEIEECGSEILALLAEEREIRERRPLLNVQREVHPRARAPQRAQNLAALLPAANPAEAVFLFFRPPDHLSTFNVPRAGELPEALARQLRGRVRDLLRAGKPDGGAGEAQMRIAAGWLALYRDRLPTVDLSTVRGEEHALALLDCCRRTPHEAAVSRHETGSGIEYR